MTDDKKAGYKIPDDVFWKELRACRGNFGKTARRLQEWLIKEEDDKDATYTRQAVNTRAKSQPERFADIIEDHLDFAEEVIDDVLVSKDDAVRFRAASWYLKMKGKGRGYVDKAIGEGGGMPIKVEIEIKGGSKPPVTDEDDIKDVDF